MRANTWCLAAKNLPTIPPLPSPPECVDESNDFQCLLPASQFLTPGLASLLVLGRLEEHLGNQGLLSEQAAFSLLWLWRRHINKCVL